MEGCKDEKGGDNAKNYKDPIHFKEPIPFILTQIVLRYAKKGVVSWLI